VRLPRSGIPSVRRRRCARNQGPSRCGRRLPVGADDGVLGRGSDASSGGGGCAYLTTVGQWGTATVNLVYGVGSSDAGFGTTFAARFRSGVVRPSRMRAMAFELTDTTGIWHGTDTHVGVVVAHFATGWRVWSAFH